MIPGGIWLEYVNPCKESYEQIFQNSNFERMSRAAGRTRTDDQLVSTS